MTIFRTVLVPLDGSAQAARALPVAAALATSENATLHIVSLGERERPPDELLRALGLGPEVLRGAVLDQVTGDPAVEVPRLVAAQPDPLIVLATRTEGEQTRGELGTTARAIVSRFACPMVLVPPERPLTSWRLQHVLLPEDGSPAMAAALDPAAELARHAGAEVVVLHVAEAGASPPVQPGTLTTPLYLDQPQHEWPAWASEFMGRLTALGHAPGSVRLRLAVAAGDPGEEIVRFAEREAVDLVVLARQGESWGERRHADTVRTVIADSSVPVLLTCAAPPAVDGGGSSGPGA